MLCRAVAQALYFDRYTKLLAPAGPWHESFKCGPETQQLVEDLDPLRDSRVTLGKGQGVEEHLESRAVSSTMALESRAVSFGSAQSVESLIQEGAIASLMGAVNSAQSTSLESQQAMQATQAESCLELEIRSLSQQIMVSVFPTTTCADLAAIIEAKLGLLDCNAAATQFESAHQSLVLEDSPRSCRTGCLSTRAPARAARGTGGFRGFRGHGQAPHRLSWQSWRSLRRSSGIFKGFRGLLPSSTLASSHWFACLNAS